LIYYLQKRNFAQCPTNKTLKLPILLQPYKLAVHIARLDTLLLLRWHLDVNLPLLLLPAPRE